MDKKAKEIAINNTARVIESWAEFAELIPDHAAGLDFILKKLFEFKFIRCACGNTEEDQFIRIRDRVLRCKKCKDELWFLGKTCFTQVKVFQAWLGAEWLMVKGMMVTSYRLCRLANIAHATAHNIVTTWHMYTKNHLLANEYEKSSTLNLNQFIEILIKRSLISEAYCHPSVEAEETRKGRGEYSKRAGDKAKESEFFHHPDTEFTGDNAQESDSNSDLDTASNAKRNSDFESSAESNLDSDAESDFDSNSVSNSNQQPEPSSAEDHLTETIEPILEMLETPISQDSLCTLTNKTSSEVNTALVILEMSGLIEALPGGMFVKRKPALALCAEKITAKIRFLMNDAMDLIRSIHRGVSRKYLQLYLASLWCVEDRDTWTECSLLKLGLKEDPISHNDVLAYITPPLVSIRNVA